MREVLAWLESSALGTFIRDSSLWTYPVVNLVHILGIAALFGAVLVIDLRLMGLWRRVPLGSITTVAGPVAATGFVLAAVSGVCLLAANALDYERNPLLLVKFSAIGVGLVNAVALRLAWKFRRNHEPAPAETWPLRIVGGVSLLSWLTAIAAGRMIAYW